MEAGRDSPLPFAEGNQMAQAAGCLLEAVSGSLEELHNMSKESLFTW